MADDNTIIVNDAAVVGAEQEKQPDVKNDAAFRDDTLDFIRTTQKAQGDIDGKGADDAVDKGTENVDVVDSAVLPELSGVDIPDVFSDIAEKAGMTPGEIVKYADGHTDAELLELASEMLRLIEPKQEVKPESKPQVDKKSDKGDDKNTDEESDEEIDSDIVAKITDKISKQLEEKFSATLKDIETFKASQEEQSVRKTTEAVSKKFDEAFKEFPVFGKTEELPKFPSGKLAGQFVPTSPAMKARLEVLKYAGTFMKSGANVDNAMDDALATYRGKHLTKEMERNLVKDLKRHESKLSGARIGKETAKKYADTREEIIDEIRQLQKAHGLET